MPLGPRELALRAQREAWASGKPKVVHKVSEQFVDAPKFVDAVDRVPEKPKGKRIGRPASVNARQDEAAYRRALRAKRKPK